MSYSFLEILDSSARSRTFNPSLWAKYGYWTVAEIAAFSLGRHPEDPILSNSGVVSTSKIAREYSERVEVASRAQKVGAMRTDCSPVEAIQWLEQNKFPFPPELKHEVIKFASSPDKVKTYQEIVRFLVHKIEKLETSALTEKISPKRVTSYERIIAALVYAAYKYDPSKKYSDVPKLIADDMADLELELSQPVISKIIKEACINQGFKSLPDLN